MRKGLPKRGALCYAGGVIEKLVLIAFGKGVVVGLYGLVTDWLEQRRSSRLRRQ